MASQTQIEIVGVVKDPHFHAARSIAEELKQLFPDDFLDPEIVPLLEFDWHEYLCNKKRELRGDVWEYPSNVICFLNGVFLGNEKQLASWAENQWNFTATHPEDFYTAITEESYAKHLQNTGHKFVFMDIVIAGEDPERISFELFSDVCPKASENFEALCTGEQGTSESGLPLHYKGSLFHRIVPNGWVQGGDISPQSKGDGGESIYGPTFEDESFAISHSKRGILGMANKGPHTNGSQFYITLQPTPWMDKTYVAFGQVIEGVEVLKKLEESKTFNERPKYECRVSACGVLPI
ncbi:probable inactive peptidyl-prolyl cis-trans isomerase-like 6 [Poeciliopsis prolifica]|uniref:probable inactive peptidyl-prolyl cis-trans isomerase-like 6 n=1 Tax=Poeciliopsis prolifica TaxID=188132 RepID=UPI0024144301|nr:probable inactive peptidyl-prolyl cis-trans isomerase-like 6 [Poeciliopsis prolifica]